MTAEEMEIRVRRVGPVTKSFIFLWGAFSIVATGHYIWTEILKW